MIETTSSRPSYGRPDNQKCEARLGNHSCGSGSLRALKVRKKLKTPPPASLKGSSDLPALIERNMEQKRKGKSKSPPNKRQSLMFH